MNASNFSLIIFVSSRLVSSSFFQSPFMLSCPNTSNLVYFRIISFFRLVWLSSYHLVLSRCVSFLLSCLFFFSLPLVGLSPLVQFLIFTQSLFVLSCLFKFSLISLGLFQSYGLVFLLLISFLFVLPHMVVSVLFSSHLVFARLVQYISGLSLIYSVYSSTLS